MVASAWRVEIDTASDEPFVNRINILDQKVDPGSEPAGLVLPVGDRHVKPDLAIADHQLDIATTPSSSASVPVL